MTKPHFLESICKSDSRIESIFELFSKNCIDIGGAARGLGSEAGSCFFYPPGSFS